MGNVSLDYLEIKMGNAIFTLIGGILGYVAGVIKDVINNKHELNKIRFTKLHEKQACVVAELYSRIVKVNEKSMAYFSPFGTMKPDERLPLAEGLGDAMVEFLEFYRPHEIYLSDSTCNLINKLLNSLKDVAGTYSIYLLATKTANEVDEKKRVAQDRMDAWKDGYYSLKDSGEISNMLKELKAELRNLIGVK
jgi:hypothetical protein